MPKLETSNKSITVFCLFQTTEHSRKEQQKSHLPDPLIPVVSLQRSTLQVIILSLTSD